MIITTFTIKRNRRLALKSDNTEIDINISKWGKPLKLYRIHMLNSYRHSTASTLVTCVAKLSDRENQNCTILHYLSAASLSYSQTFTYCVLTQGFYASFGDVTVNCECVGLIL